MTGPEVVRGRKYASTSWTVETLDLRHVTPTRERGQGILGTNQPDGDGAWLLAKQTGRVCFVRTHAELTELGVPMARLKLIKEW